MVSRSKDVKLTDWTQQEPMICSPLQETQFRWRIHIDWKWEAMEKDISCKWKWQEKAGVTILTSDKIGFETKFIKKDKQGTI